MVTGTQLQIAWAPWIRDTAEMLETHLPEIKHQGEPKLQHSEPLAHGNSSTPWFTKRTACPPSPHPIGPLSCHFTLPFPLPIGPTRTQLHMGPHHSGHQTPALQTCQIAASPGPRTAGLPNRHSAKPPSCKPAIHHRRATNLPRRQDRQDWMLKD
jgi:hypothetical protein